MTKTTKKAISIDLSIYPVLVIVGDDLDTIGNLVKKHTSPKLEIDFSSLEAFERDPYTDGYVTQLSLDAEEAGIIVARFKGKPPVSTIAHECIHIKNKIYQYINMDIRASEVCDEQEAYLVEHLVRQIYDLFYGK
jgi:hypothetical protein